MTILEKKWSQKTVNETAVFSMGSSGITGFDGLQPVPWDHQRLNALLLNVGTKTFKCFLKSPLSNVINCYLIPRI
jgi:hypothetical protein